MATVNLGRIKPVFRGAYSGSTAYVVDDIVTSGGSTYICIQAHGAGTQAVSQTAYWTLMAEGGDVASTLTTQGDVLYRDGSGLQRLAKGTASQVLKMNTAANAPEWGNLSSDFVKLASTNITSDTTEIDFLSVFTTDYEFYKIYLSCFAGSTGSNINFRAITGTNTVDTNGGSYFQFGMQARMTTGGSNDSPANYGSHNHGEVYLTYPAGIAPGTGQDYGNFGVIEIARPWDSANSKFGHVKHIYRDNGTKITLVNGGFAYRPTTAMTGFRIYSSTFNRGRVSVYGVKH